MKFVSLLLVSLSIVRSEPDDDSLLPAAPPNELKMAALSAFQDKKVFAEAWKHAAEDLHKRYQKIREKRSGRTHHRKIRRVVYEDED
jgi:hypothetical protein